MAMAARNEITGIGESVAQRAMVDALGIPADSPGATAPLAIVRLIEEGLPVSALDRVACIVLPEDPAGLRNRLVARATAARIRRSPTQRLSTEASERVARLARVWGRAVEVWKTPAGARAFLDRPHPLLDGRRPLDVVVATDAGAQVVEAILGRLQYGSAA